MKNTLTLKTLLLVSLSLTMASLSAQPLHLVDWTLHKEGDAKVYKAVVPTTVGAVLFDEGALGADPYYSSNYHLIDKAPFGDPWTFETTFKVKARKGQHVLLTFNSLNFYADIVLNGNKIASSDKTSGVFIKREYDVTPFIKKGKNHLSVTLSPARKGDLNVGYVDWNPRALGESMGITGDVFLSVVDEVRIADVGVRPLYDPSVPDKADLHVQASLTNLSSSPVSGDVVIEFEGRRAKVPVTLRPGENELTWTPSEVGALHLDNPRIWWTWDLGTPEMYDMKVSFLGKRKASDSRTVSFGIRSIESTVTPDNHRQFFLNGRPVLIKGGGWTDELLMRDTHESLSLQARYVIDMGMNTIRFENIWGKDDYIYDCCDRLGLLAMVGWSCQWEWEDYCGLPETKGFGCINDPASEDMAVAYFHDQVLRLRNHPSVICWLTGSDRIPNERLEERYMEIYNKYEYRPYVCSAKGISSKYGGHSGMKMEGPYEYVGPDYWYLDKKAGGAYGFNTETGVGMNIPQIPSLRRMISPSDLWPIGKDWSLHCTASSSNMNSPARIAAVMEATYGKAATLEEFVGRAHALDYDATRAMFESFRCNFPTSTGIIQWMLNSAWPSLYWQQYDFYMAPTAAYYGTRKACRGVQLIYNYALNSVFAVNETPSDCEGRARIKVFDSSSSLILEKEVPLSVRVNTPVSVFSLPERKEPVFLSLELLDKDGSVKEDNFYCLPAQGNTYDWKRTSWFDTPITEFADMTFVTSLPKAELTMGVDRKGGEYIVTLTNTSSVISYQNILQLLDGEGNLIAPAFWSDNFVSLLPGQTKVLTCKVEDAVTGKIELQTWNSTLK